MIRTLDTPDTPLPRIAILGRAPYTTMVSGAGSGASRFGDIAINRWRNDGTRDAFGQWCYLKDVRAGTTWSAGHQPVCAKSSSYAVEMAVDRVTIRRRDGAFETVTEIVVLPGTGAESRRVTVSNRSNIDAEVELTSYQEVVLATNISDRGHKAFGNLFVQTEWLAGEASILAMRRPRSKKNLPAWCGHTIAVSGACSAISCETDRARFVSRGRTARNPVAMDKLGDLSGTVGAVLDPVLALRTTVLIAAGESAQVIFTTFVAENRDEAARLASRFHDYSNAEAAFESSHAQGERELRELSVTAVEAAKYQDIAGVLLYGSRPAGAMGEPGPARPGRADLLAMGIAGDHPIVLAELQSADDMGDVTEILRLHRYWKEKGIAADVVILCNDRNGNERLGNDVAALVAEVESGKHRDDEGGVFVRSRALLGPRELAALEIAARIRIECGARAFAELANV